MHLGRIRRYFKHGTLGQLRVFEAVVRHGGYTRAAAELHLAQPTVSVQIKKLTETVGTPLLEVRARRVHPTAAGYELHKACLDLFARLSALEDALDSLQAEKNSAPT
jgi:LysR family transcriptional regulator, low CO2-responsive transcriptional regulator